MVPVFLVFMLMPGISGGNYIAASIFAIASASDFLYGGLARKNIKKLSVKVNNKKYTHYHLYNSLYLSPVICCNHNIVVRRNQPKAADNMCFNGASFVAPGGMWQGQTG